MTEHSKFPPTPESSAEKPVKGHSSIERAVETFDLHQFLPPDVPSQLPAVSPRLARRAKRIGIEELGADTASLSGVRPAEPRLTAEAPQAAEPLVIEGAATPVAVSPRRSEVKAAVFTGKQHVIDRDHLREQGMIVPEGSVTGLLEEFRIVKRQVLLQASQLREMDRDDPRAQRVLVCSPLPNEGKTYCAVNLALSMAAEKESEVLLVDADFAKPSVLTALGMPGGPGLMDALVDPKLDVTELVLGTDVPGLFVLPAGNATNSDSEYLSSARTADVLAQLTAGAPHRMIIFDSPPALAASPAAELAKYVGQAVVVARADRTGQGALEDALSLLAGCPNIRLLLNAATFSPSGRRFGTYYGYKG
jgi:Mrp family chromosome partitioning ATPase